MPVETDQYAIVLGPDLARDVALAHPDEAFVIFDDCPKLGHYVGTKHFIHTTISTGITQALADQAIQVLGRRIEG